MTVCLNAERFIGECLASVARQSCRNIEHVVVDGGSTDGTLSIIKRAGEHVARVVSEPDTGIYNAMNKGAALCRGKYIAFLNADDSYVDPLVIEQCVSELEKSAANYCVVYADLDYITSGEPARVVRRWRSGRFSRRSLKFGWMPPHPTFMVSSNLFRDLGGYCEDLRISGDYDFMLRCLSRSDVDVRYLGRVTVQMRLGGASNRSVRALYRKSMEDLRVVRRRGIGGIATVICKNLRKMPQLVWPSAGAIA